MKPQAILCDRDGTLIKEQHFLDSPEKMQWIPGVLSSIKELKASGIKVLVLTNQSGVARGYFGIDTVEAIHQKMQQDVKAAGGAIADFYYCPHHPQGVVQKYSYVCNCRKPAPGLFKQAIRDHQLDPRKCWAIGDRVRDIEPGLRLGMKAFLVKSGYGSTEENRLFQHKDAGEMKIIENFPEVISKIKL